MLTKFPFAVRYGHYNSFFFARMLRYYNFYISVFLLINLNITETEILQALRKPQIGVKKV